MQQTTSLSTSSAPEPQSEDRESVASASTKKISHACDRCRAMRTRCTGGPRCSECIKNSSTCLYSDRKRERSKKEYAYYKERISGLITDRQDLLNLLKKIEGSTDMHEDERAQVVQMLQRFSVETPTSATETIEGSTPLGYPTAQGGIDLPGEKETASDIASQAGSGQLTQAVNLDSGKGLSGFIGNISEVSWLYRAWQHCSSQEVIQSQEAGRDPILAPPLAGTHVSLSADAFVYFMDEDDVLAVEESLVNPLQLPSFETSTLLSEAYFHSSKGVFCFIDEAAFYTELYQYVTGQETLLSSAGHKWLMKANVVWACGAKWLQTSQIPRSTDLESHLIYYARARALGFDHRIPLDHPDLEMVEASGVLASYLMTNGSVSRAWNVLGHALRLATALGLHLKIHGVTAHGRERRAETWFSLQNLEILLSELSGRPKCVDLSEVAVRYDPHIQPDAARDETAEQARLQWQSLMLSLRRGYGRAESENNQIQWSRLLFADSDTSKLCFKAQSDLYEISDEIRLRLYCQTENVTWHRFQNITHGLHRKLTQWRARLPQALQFDPAQTSPLTSRFQIQLCAYFTSLQITLWRPCIYEIQILHESRQSQRFNSDAARTCIQSALFMIDILPASGVALEADGIFQWWLTLHYICQALAILLLELALKAPHCNSLEMQRVKAGISKAFACLRLLSDHYKSAFTCWQLCRYLLGKGMERCGLLVTDMPSEVFAPQSWTREDQDGLERLLQKLMRHKNLM